MKARTKRKPAKPPAKRQAVAARAAAKRSKPHRRTGGVAKRKAVKPRHRMAVKALQSAAASLPEDDLIELVSQVPWATRAKLLSSYFADQLDAEAEAAALAEAVEELGAQVAALLEILEAAEPDDYLHAVTCCLSGDPAHVDAGLSWLERHTGTSDIDIDELAGLPGYLAVIEALEQLDRQLEDE